MDTHGVISWCIAGSNICWARGEWITLWAGFGGVFFAFFLGVISQIVFEKWRQKSALRFLRETLLKSLDAISFFDDEFRRIGDEDQIGHGFGGLGHASAAIRWASAHPEKFPPAFFLRLLKIEDRITNSGKIGPAAFSGANFTCDASTYLARTVPPVADDIRFLLGIPVPSRPE